MSGAWGCPHEVDGICQRVNGARCKPGMRGCVLDGKVELADERSRIPRWPEDGGGKRKTPGEDREDDIGRRT